MNKTDKEFVFLITTLLFLKGGTFSKIFIFFYGSQVGMTFFNMRKVATLCFKELTCLEKSQVNQSNFHII